MSDELVNEPPLPGELEIDRLNSTRSDLERAVGDLKKARQKLMIKLKRKKQTEEAVHRQDLNDLNLIKLLESTVEQCMPVQEFGDIALGQLVPWISAMEQKFSNKWAPKDTEDTERVIRCYKKLQLLFYSFKTYAGKVVSIEDASKVNDFKATTSSWYDDIIEGMAERIERNKAVAALVSAGVGLASGMLTGRALIGIGCGLGVGVLAMLVVGLGRKVAMKRFAVRSGRVSVLKFVGVLEDMEKFLKGLEDALSDVHCLDVGALRILSPSSTEGLPHCPICLSKPEDGSKIVVNADNATCALHFVCEGCWNAYQKLHGQPCCQCRMPMPHVQVLKVQLM